MLHLDLTKLEGFIPQDYLTQRMAGLEKAASMLANHDGPGGDFTGWVYLPRDYDKEEFARIQAAAKKIQQQSQVLVVIGIGGSYLGARAVIDLLASPNYNLKKKDTPDILFAGNGRNPPWIIAPTSPGRPALQTRSASPIWTPCAVWPFFLSSRCR